MTIFFKYFLFTGVPCGVPTLSNAVLGTPTKTTFGGTANATCNAGFTQNGAVVQLTCRLEFTVFTGMWRGPICAGKFTDSICFCFGVTQCIAKIISRSSKLAVTIRC